MNDTLSILINRSSIRNYRNEEIKKEDIDLINQAIYHSPTAGNMQDFSVIIVKDIEVKTKLSILCDNQSFIKKASHLYIFIADYTRYDRLFKLSGIEDYSPHLGSMTNMLVDATIAAQTASVAANSLDIGTCYIGDIVENKEEITELLNLSSMQIPICMLTLGYHDVALKKSPKINEDFIFHNEQYNHATDAEIMAMFATKQVPKLYQDKYDNYGQYFYAKKVNADFSQEMHRCMELYIKNFRR